MKNHRTIVLAINDVETGLVAATKRLSKRLGRKLTGIVLVDARYAGAKDRAKDKTGLFKEIVCDFDNPTAIQEALKPYADKILVATCRMERSILSFRRVIPFLPYINTPSESSLLWSTQKRLMRDRLHTYDKNLVPKYYHIEDSKDEYLHMALDDLEFPVIVKPNGLASSMLVSLCHNEQELRECLEQTFEVIQDVYERDMGRGRPSVLVEELMQGDMYSVDAYVDPDGEVYCLPPTRVFTPFLKGEDGFYGSDVIIPSGLSDEQAKAAQDTATAAVRALNLSASTAHVELFLTKDGWKIIELGPRIGGYREAVYRESYGIDHYYNDLLVRLGMEPEIPTEPIGHAFALNLYADQEGVIEAIDGLKEAQKLESVVYLTAHAKPGDTALSATNGGCLIIDGILSNVDKDRLDADVAKVRELINIRVNATKLSPQHA